MLEMIAWSLRLWLVLKVYVDSDKFQEWYRVITTFPIQAMSEAQCQINSIMKKYVEGGNRSNRQKQSYFYGTESWRDMNIVLQNRLVKVKSGVATVRRNCETYLQQHHVY